MTSRHGAKVVFGSVARRSKPARVPRPPTESGGSPTLDPLGWEFVKIGGTPPATVSVNYETGVEGDIILLVSLGGMTTAGTGFPSGFTQFDRSSADAIYIHYKIANGTESGTAEWTSPSKGMYCTNRVKANGATLTVDNWLFNDATNSLNPPAVTLVDFDYVVLPILQAVLDIVGDEITTIPTDYTEVVNGGPATENADWNGAIAQKMVTGPAANDPSTFGTTNPAITKHVGTLAIEISPPPPAVSAPGHTHTEADITDTATGVATILNGNASIAVTHGLSTTPTNVLVTPRADPGDDVWVDTIGATQFTINVGTNVVADTDFGWLAFP